MRTTLRRLKGSAEAGKALANTNWLLLEKLLSLPLGLVLSIMLARHLGVEQLGVYSYLLSVVYLVSPLAAMGLSSLITRELVNQPESEKQIMGACLLVRLFGAITGMLCLLLYASFQQGSELLWLSLLAISQIFNTLTFIDFWFQSRVEVKVSVFSRLSAVVLLFMARMAAIIMDASLQWFVWLFAAEQVLTALFFIAFYWWRGGSPFQWQMDFGLARRLVRQSYWLILSGFAAVVYLRMDMVMLSKIAGDEQTGLYAVASRISEIWYFIPAAVVSSFFPMLLRNRQHSLREYHMKLQRLCDGLMLLAVAVILPVMLVAEYVIVLLYGAPFAGAAVILQIHIIAGLFIFMRALLSKWLIAESLFKYSLVTQGLGALSNVGLNLLLIPEFGAQGAAWATLVSYAVASYLALFFSSQTRPFAFIMTRSLLLPLRPLMTAQKTKG